MGLDISHDAFHGAYSAFNRFRQVIAECMNGSWPPHQKENLDRNLWYYDEPFSPTTHPGLFELMNHSDCDGEIAPDMCMRLAEELEALLPEIEKYGTGEGHIASQGGYAEVTNKFIEGCKLAAENNEPLLFG